MKNNLFPVIFIVLVVILGYYQIFCGANFFVEEDHLIVYWHTHGNAIGNGWRPDKGFGISYFFNDPGLAHPWSLFTLWERFLGSGILAYNSSIIFLLILAALAQYIFLKHIAPEIGIAAVFLAPLIVFGPLQYEFFFQRHWITLSIGTPLLFMLLDKYCKKAKAVHLMLGAFIFWFVLFFGSFVSFSQLMILGMIFICLHCVYYKVPLRSLIPKSIIFYLAAVIGTFLLGAWIFYSIYVEKSLISYIRDPQYFNQGFIDVKEAVYFLIARLHSGWLSGKAILAGGGFMPVVSWANCSVLFPLILVFFIFRKSRTFWEFLFKWAIVLLYANELLMDSFPHYFNFINSIFKGYPLSKFHPAYHALQIGLIAIFIREIGRYSFKPLSAALVRITALMLSFFYFCLVIFCLLALIRPAFVPGVVSQLIERFFPANIAGYSKPFFLVLVSFNIQRMQEVMSWYSLLFYLSSAVMALFFLNTKWLGHLIERGKTLFAVLLLLNGILLCWTIYPLNNSKIAWEKEDFLKSRANFNPTDRFYKIFDESSRTKKDIESFKKNWMNDDGSPAQSPVGLWSVPYLNISSIKSFTQKDVANFIYLAFNKDRKIISDMRSLIMGPLVDSDLLDMGAVSYYYSPREFTKTPHYLSSYFKMDQIFIYKKPSAWPYFYLADKFSAIDDIKQLVNLKQGTAYLYKNDFSRLSDPKGKATVELKKFSYGKMVFNYSGESDNLLVIADAWHPFWKARAGDIQLPVIKANGIFKAIKLPKGKHVITLYFDTSAYRPGIIVAVAAWLIFLLFMSLKREGKR